MYKATAPQRSMAFQAAIALREEELDLSGTGDHIEIIHAAYTEALPLLEPLHVKKLRPRDYDDRFLELLETFVWPYHHLISQHDEEYWTNLRALGNADDFPEIGMLKSRKHDLRVAWKKTYVQPRKKKIVTFSEELIADGS